MIDFNSLKSLAMVDKNGKIVNDSREEYYNSLSEYIGFLENASGGELEIIGIGINLYCDTMWLLEYSSVDCTYIISKYWVYENEYDYRGIVYTFDRQVCAQLALDAFTLDGITE